MEPLTDLPDSPPPGGRSTPLDVVGAVLTATEVEGCATAADWSRWITAGRVPPSGDGAGFAGNASDDLAQLAALGCGEVALTLEWARLEPRPGHHDQEAVEALQQRLRAAREQGLTVWGCLVDGTLPGWFADDEGGLADERARSLIWPRHIDWLGEHVGDLVDGWVPQREPIHWALRRHLLGTAPPGQRDPVATAAAVSAAIEADGEAWRLLRGTAPVAMFQTARAVTATVDDVRARPRAGAIERLLWDSWIRALDDGVVSVGDLPARRADHLRGAFDRVVVALRPGLRVDRDGRWHPWPADVRPGPSGMTAFPELQIESLRRVADRVDRPIVAAGDLADVPDDGRSRPDHVQAMLEGVAEAAADTSVTGWWQTSPLDGYHWERGRSLHPGLIATDRSETAAAGAFRRMVGGG